MVNVRLCVRLHMVKLEERESTASMRDNVMPIIVQVYICMHYTHIHSSSMHCMHIQKNHSSIYMLGYIIHTYVGVCTYVAIYLLDISRQLACMKLGSREKYQPIQYCWVHISRLLGYLVSYMPFASNKSVAAPRQDSIRACSAHAVLSGCCNIYLYIETETFEGMKPG